VVQAYPKADEMTLRRLLIRGLNAWLIAAPLGLMLRAFLFDRGGIPAIFMLLTLLVAGAFILLLAAAFWAGCGKRESEIGDPITVFKD
jgi:hypothetical protein